MGSLGCNLHLYRLSNGLSGIWYSASELLPALLGLREGKPLLILRGWEMSPGIRNDLQNGILKTLKLQKPCIQENWQPKLAEESLPRSQPYSSQWQHKRATLMPLHIWCNSQDQHGCWSPLNRLSLCCFPYRAKTTLLVWTTTTTKWLCSGQLEPPLCFPVNYLFKPVTHRAHLWKVLSDL